MQPRKAYSASRNWLLSAPYLSARVGESLKRHQQCMGYYVAVGVFSRRRLSFFSYAAG